MSEARDERDLSPAQQAGMSVPEYERRVWDMARHHVHPTFLYVLLQVIGISRLMDHELFRDPDLGLYREWGLFLASFLGAWAVFYSTLLRTSGLASLTVTLLVPTAAAALAVVWFAFPAPPQMSREAGIWAAAVLTGPGVVGWVLTMRRWLVARREAARLLEGGEAA